jgi:integrase
VFPGNFKAGHYVGLAKAFEGIAKRAKVPDITPHGLRHWFASATAEMNYSDFIIGGMLGHAKRSTHEHEYHVVWNAARKSWDVERDGGRSGQFA